MNCRDNLTEVGTASQKLVQRRAGDRTLLRCAEHAAALKILDANILKSDGCT